MGHPGQRTSNPLPVEDAGRTDGVGSRRGRATAGRGLQEANNIFIVGYSLPPTDQFFRYLFALGTLGPTRLRRVWVFNPDQSKAVEGRFRGLVGRGVVGRFRYISGKAGLFENAISQIGDAVHSDLYV